MEYYNSIILLLTSIIWHSTICKTAVSNIHFSSYRKFWQSCWILLLSLHRDSVCRLSLHKHKPFHPICCMDNYPSNDNCRCTFRITCWHGKHRNCRHSVSMEETTREVPHRQICLVDRYILPKHHLLLDKERLCWRTITHLAVLPQHDNGCTDIRTRTK